MYENYHNCEDIHWEDKETKNERLMQLNQLINCTIKIQWRKSVVISSYYTLTKLMIVEPSTALSWVIIFNQNIQLRLLILKTK